LSGRGLCDELITRPEESYRLWCVVLCDLETSRIGAPYIYDISNLRVKATNTYWKYIIFYFPRLQWLVKYVLFLSYTVWSKSLWAPDKYNTTVRCTETFWSTCTYVVCHAGRLTC
jgi:hypothetical protein